MSRPVENAAHSTLSVLAGCGYVRACRVRDREGIQCPTPRVKGVIPPHPQCPFSHEAAKICAGVCVAQGEDTASGTLW